MKKILMTLTLFALATAYAGGREAPIGGQTDARGCLTGAGQSWSVLKQACVQPWNVADVRLPDPNNSQLAVYVLFSGNGQQAELMGQNSVLLRLQGTEYVSKDGLTRLVKDGNTWRLNVEKMAPIGGQRDKHGCLSAAGQSWSALRGECVQVFSVADIRLQDPHNATQGVFVLLSADKTQAELFGLGYSEGVMLSKTATGYRSADGKVRLQRVVGGWALR